MKRWHLLILSFTFLLQPTFAKILPRPNKKVLSPSTSLKEIRSSIIQQNRKILSIKKEINHLETSLKSGNKHFLHILSKKNKLSSTIFNFEEQLQNIRTNLNLLQSKARKLLLGMVVNSLDQKSTPDELLGNYILTQDFKTQIDKIEDAHKRNDQIISTLTKQKEQNREFSNLEDELSLFLSELEERKREKAISYLHETKKNIVLKNKLSKFKKRLSKKTSSRAINKINFHSPLTTYKNLKYKKKGLTFEFDEELMVRATEKGVIDFSGTLANYGTIVMINHGNNIRSILLGSFKSKVEKGKKVTQGELIGLTNQDASRKTGNLYFEIREKNKPQNTIRLVDKLTLNQHNIVKNRHNNINENRNF